MDDDLASGTESTQRHHGGEGAGLLTYASQNDRL